MNILKAKIIISARLPAFIIIAGIISLIYSNTFHSEWHFDDLPNIVHNSFLHIESIKPNTIFNSWFSNPSDPFHLNTKLYRPVACMSFALNWYFDQGNVVGYHIINTIIHIFTGFFIYLFLINLFLSPNLINKYRHYHMIALGTAILWAVNPIQTQAVTYIVQRMTQLAAIFYMLGLYSYIKARNNISLTKNLFWFFNCIIFYLLALGSKENAAIFPLAIIIIEALFYQNLKKQKSRNIIILIFSLFTILFIFIGSYFFLHGFPSAFLKGYTYRNFSLTERLLAESRIIIYYLYQIFCPLPNQFSITHDIILSNSICTPWTTIPSIVLILTLLCIGILQSLKNPLLTFAIFFYFLNHVIESSVIPIELIFEHRNYLPSSFLFLPVMLFLNKILTKYKNHHFKYRLMIIIIIFSITGISYSTFVRNKAWMTEETLWRDALLKAPNSARPLNNIAVQLAWGNNSIHPNRYDLAISLFKKALNKYQSRTYLKADILGNIASIYLNNKHNYDKAIGIYKDAISINPESDKIRHDLVTALILKSNWEKALKNVNILIKSNNENEVYHSLKGFILLWKGDYKKALISLQKALKIAPYKITTLINTGVALDFIGDHNTAELFLLRSHKAAPKEIMIFFYLIENSIRANNKIKLANYANQLFESFKTSTIKKRLGGLSQQRKYPPVTIKLILPIINKRIIKN